MAPRSAAGGRFRCTEIARKWTRQCWGAASSPQMGEAPEERLHELEQGARELWNPLLAGNDPMSEQTLELDLESL